MLSDAFVLCIATEQSVAQCSTWRYELVLLLQLLQLEG